MNEGSGVECGLGTHPTTFPGGNMIDLSVVSALIVMLLVVAFIKQISLTFLVLIVLVFLLSHPWHVLATLCSFAMGRTFLYKITGCDEYDPRKFQVNEMSQDHIMTDIVLLALLFALWWFLGQALKDFHT
ncbi:MAG: hypothetical protein HQL96_01685 [Magnetococcales bacterium]|nr:hypothetical protein [Magnetococcales bacterium]